MIARRIFVLLLATVLVGRTLHCCYVQAEMCAVSAQKTDTANLPLKNPNDTDPNETGCICKGAVLKAPCVFEAVRTALEGQNPLALPSQPAAVAIAIAPLDSRPGNWRLLGPPPLSGMALRAWVGSLTI